MTPLVVDPSAYLKPHHSVGHCPTPSGQSRGAFAASAVPRGLPLERSLHALATSTARPEQGFDGRPGDTVR